jgi:Fic family protein
MDASTFQSPRAGKIVQLPAGYSAFIPAPLPPDIRYDPDLVLQLSRADAAVSELSGLGRNLPNPRLLIAPYVHREAVMSSRIEGTRATLSDLLLDEVRNAPSEDAADVREVGNYIRALEHGMARLRELPLSLRLVREIHAQLMEGVRGEQATPGEFRRSQNWIGPPGSTPATAAYVPPPPTELMEVLGNWERFLHDRDIMPDLIQCAVMHDQFEAIHPFLDGNGRVGRLLIVLFLMERGRLSAPLLYVSTYFEAHRYEYYDALQRTRSHGDWEGWLRFFLAGVTESAQSGVKQAAGLIALREDLRSRVSRKPKALALVDELFINPYITVARAAELLETSLPTARQALRSLEGERLLQEVTGRRWGRLYVAGPILAAIEWEPPSRRA